ncbi:RNA recognition motif domain [Macleaya cordata]|uniref:RNA recognition motif domain n=1 Tax=Macleaya cordata TaxID=56857 RepID=A0A200QJ81_MACCD|nr:RNA recognition motif domain [Macleaya cordata]
MVEYQFSDMSLFASDTLMKHINKDPEGYVPLSVIASSKKIKSLVSNNHLLIQALRASSKLVISDDGKKVRRKHLFTERDKEDLQARTVVAENLPEDYTHQNLEKIFGVVGSVKTVRICHPQESNASRPKGDVLISNKLHALVEYETVVQAEKAVEKLNDERNWRKGLRVRLLLRRSPRSVIKSRKSDYDHFDGISEDDEGPSPASVDESSSQPNSVELPIESNVEDNSTGSRKGWARVRGKTRGRSQNHSGRGLIAPSPQSCSSIQCEASTNKHTPRGPRMPDGTRGFTMGRGKPLSPLAVTTSSSQVE